MRACRPWLEAEIALVRPRILVLLGATAAQGLLGGSFRVSQQRGKLIKHAVQETTALATFHPSAVLRAPTQADRERQFGWMVMDLRTAARAAEGESG